MVETSASSAAAIRCIAERGYDSTTAGDLASALGISRSTFFRRFRSKDDVVFADHDLALLQLEESLEHSAADAPRIPDVLITATRDVLRLLTQDASAARMRFELLRLHPPLRSRELVITHRYERVFTGYLTEVLPAKTPAWVPVALAASIVAVHNAMLRAWLRGEETDVELAVVRELRELTSLYARWLTPENAQAPQRVLVAVYDTEGPAEAILDAVASKIVR